MYQDLTLGVIVVAALLDSINPCVLGVLIFLISYLLATFYKNRNRMLLSAAVYILAVYVTYFFIGLGILKFTVSTGFTNTFYWIAGSIAIVAGLLELKDFFWYGRGFSLAIIPGGDVRIKYYTKKIGQLERRHRLYGLLISLFLGFFVVLVEFPCTGAPYLAILALISSGYLSRAIPYLLLYNLVFIIPLVVIVGLAYFGKSSDALEEWRKRHRKLMRLLVGVFLLALGGWMIYTVLPAQLLR